MHLDNRENTHDMCMCVSTKYSLYIDNYAQLTLRIPNEP